MNYYELMKAAAIAGSGGGTPTPQPVLIEKSVTQNGAYNAEDDEADGYSAVTVNVPNSYAAGDEGKVVNNGALVSQTSTTATTNGTINTTTNNSVTVAVPNTYTAQDEGKVVRSGALVAQSTHKSITANGTGIDTTNYSSVDVAVPNSYAVADEGKVVSNGALVAQGSDTVTQNGTVDTTLINSLTVNVGGGAVKLEHNYTGGDAYIIETDNCIEIFGYLPEFTNRPSFTIPSTFDISKIGTEIGGSVYTGPSSIASFTNLGITDRTIRFQVGNPISYACLVFSYAFNKAT
jgi:hypothetical protein